MVGVEKNFLDTKPRRINNWKMRVCGTLLLSRACAYGVQLNFHGIAYHCPLGPRRLATTNYRLEMLSVTKLSIDSAAPLMCMNACESYHTGLEEMSREISTD